MIVLLTYQITIVYFKSHRIRKDIRICLLVQSTLSGIYSFLHYGVFGYEYRKFGYFVIEIFRFVVFYSLCFFYFVQASGYIKQRKVLISFLNIMFLSSLVIIGFMTIQLHQRLLDSSLKGDQQCKSPLFRFFYAYPIVVNIIYQITFQIIRKRIRTKSMSSSVDHAIFQKQMAIIIKLRKVLYFSLVTSALLFMENEYTARLRSCDQEWFKKWPVLDPLMWLVSRFMSNCVAIICCFYMLRKNKKRNNNSQLSKGSIVSEDSVYSSGVRY